MKIEKTIVDISPFDAEIKGRITEIKHYDFFCLIYKLRKRQKFGEKFIIYVGK